MNPGHPSKKTLRRRASRAARRARQRGIAPERFRAMREAWRVAWSTFVAPIREAWARIRAALAPVLRRMRPHLRPVPRRQLLHNGRKPR